MANRAENVILSLMKVASSNVGKFIRAILRKMRSEDFPFFICFLLSVTFLCLGAEAPKYMRSGNGFYSPALFLLLAIIGTCFAGILICTLWSRNSKRLACVLGVACFLLFACECVGIVLMDNVHAYFDPAGPLSFSPEEKAVFIIACYLRFLGCFVVFLLGSYFYKRHTFDYVWRIVVSIGLISLIYSLIAEWPSFHALIFQKTGDVEIHSFFTGKQSFGRFLMIAGFAELTLMHRTPKIWRFIPIVLFIAFSILCNAKTAALLLIVATVIWCIYHIFSCAKERKRSWWFAVFFLSLLLLGSAVMFFIPADLGFLGRFAASFREAFHWAPNESTIYSRNMMWKKVWTVFQDNPANAVFGFGDIAFNFIISKIQTPEKVMDYSHNVFLETVGKGGYIQFAIEAFLLLALLFVAVRAVHRNRTKNLFMPLLFFVLWIPFALIESWSFFDMFMDMILWSALSIIPLISIMQKEVPAYGEIKCEKNNYAAVACLMLSLLIPVFFTSDIEWLYVLGSISLFLPQAFLGHRFFKDDLLSIFRIVIIDLASLLMCLYFPKENSFSYLAIVVSPILVLLLSGSFLQAAFSMELPEIVLFGSVAKNLESKWDQR